MNVSIVAPTAGSLIEALKQMPANAPVRVRLHNHEGEVTGLEIKGGYVVQKHRDTGKIRRRLVKIATITGY